MNGNINDKDAESSFFEEDFEETENARRFVSTKRMSSHNDPAFAEQGDNHLVASEYDVLERDNELSEATDSSAKPARVYRRSSDSTFNADDDEELTRNTSDHNEEKFDADIHTNHSGIGMEQLRSTTLDSQLETLPKQLTHVTSTTSQRSPKQPQKRRRSCSDRTSLRSTSLDTGLDPPDLSLDQMSVQELAAALKDLSKNLRFRNIRPPWREPNSRPLPSDDAACVEEMLREYNLITSQNVRGNNKWNTTSGPTVVVRRPYHSTLNRWRQQERIQIENFCIANRLRNVRASRETSRDELLKQYKEYFVTPLTAQSSTFLSLSEACDLEMDSVRSRTGSHSSATITSRPVSANPERRSIVSARRESQRLQKRPSARRPMTGLSSRAKSATVEDSFTGRTLTAQGDRTPLTCNCITSDSKKMSSNSLRAAEVLDSLNSVRRAIYEQKQRDKQ